MSMVIWVMVKGEHEVVSEGIDRYAIYDLCGHLDKFLVKHGAAPLSPYQDTTDLEVNMMELAEDEVEPYIQSHESWHDLEPGINDLSRALELLKSSPPTKGPIHDALSDLQQEMAEVLDWLESHSSSHTKFHLCVVM